MFIAAIALLGVISFERLPVELFPDMNAPRLYVELKSGDLPPAELERKFIENLESVVMRQSKVRSVSSILQVGQGRITVEYAWDADMDEAFLDLQKSLSQIATDEEIEELNLTQYDPNSAPIVLLGLSNKDRADMDGLRLIGENYIRNELIRLDGVASVEVIGGEENEIHIQSDEAILQSYGLTLAQVASKIENANRDLTGGSIEEYGKKYVIKGLGSFANIKEIENVVVSRIEKEGTMRSTPVFLKDVAVVSFKAKEQSTIVHINGERAVALAVYKETAANTVTAAETVFEALKTIKAALPGYEFTLVNNSARFISQAIDEVEESALYGVVLAVIILFIFLRRMGTTLIISLSIPISIVATFNLMYFNGLSLNIMTLGGLALGAGMLVDNAIVVMESIFRNLEEGADLKQAVINGAAQVSGAITASTITTIIVFLPIIYVDGASGELFKSQAWTVAFSLVASLVVAILVIPMLSSKLLSAKQRQIKSITFPQYGAFLENILQKRKTVLTFAILAIILTAIAGFNMETEFIPKGESAEFTVNITLPEGTNLDYTNRFAKSTQDQIKQIVKDDVTLFYSQSGEETGIAQSASTAAMSAENNIYFRIGLKAENQHKSKRYMAAISEYLSAIGEIEFSIKPVESSLSATLGTDVTAPLTVEIEGMEYDKLKELAAIAMQKMDSLDYLRNIESGVQDGHPQINLVIDRVIAGLYGLSVSDIAQQIKQKLNEQQAGDWEFNGELRDIHLYYPNLTINQLKNSFLNVAGTRVPLSDFVRFEETVSDRELYRKDQKRTVWISADFAEGYSLSTVVKGVEEALENLHLPANYALHFSGEEEKRAESFAGLQFAFLLSLLLIYMVLASQFESLLHPFTIILTVPLAAVGAIGIFYLLNMPLNVMAFIGIIMLMGIAVNDSIILVDAINQQRWQGNTLVASIVQAGKQRIRPIIMTSLTTILALLPLTLGFGESAALRAPMALAVIGGLISSTILTLIVIPCVYYYIEKLRKQTP